MPSSRLLDEAFGVVPAVTPPSGSEEVPVVQMVASSSASEVDRRHPVDAVIAKAARCADPRSTYTPLFFSENPAEAARAKAICARCTVRQLCLARALQRGEPFGVWGGEFLVDGQVVAVRRGRGRPRKVALPAHVDEVTGEPAVA
ncbi:MAG TPA: WhiB family transcriptional regulator [Desertimonas sp.]|nr:WhiB family transcriptional regulator [Desertimonas sp.]